MAWEGKKPLTDGEGRPLDASAAESEPRDEKSKKAQKEWAESYHSNKDDVE